MSAIAKIPPRVEIPERVWRENGGFAAYMAGLAIEHGPIFSAIPDAGPFTGHDVVYMVGPEANRFVFASHRDHFSHELGWTPVVGDTLGKGLLMMDVPEHTRHRAMMNPAFTASSIAAYLPIMQRIIARRTGDWAERGDVNLLEEAREITFDIAAAALTGMESGPDVDYLRDRFYTLLHVFELERMNWEEAMEQQQRARADLVQRLLELIATRRDATATGSRDDVLGMMVRARDEQGQALTDEQLLAHVNILLVAGHETTTTLAAWVLYLLATHPDELARVEAELQTVPTDGTDGGPFDVVRGLPALTNAIREAGRLESPVMLLPRGVLRDFTFGGCTVPAGTPLFLVIAAGHRLPTLFAAPDRFDPDRFAPPREEDKRSPYALATFGGGPRICIGINFAQIEVKALAAHVLQRYRLSPIPGRDVVQTAGIVQFLPQGVPMYVRRRA